MSGLDYLEIERRARRMQGEEVRRLFGAIAHLVAQGMRLVTRSLQGVPGAPGTKRLT